MTLPPTKPRARQDHLQWDELPDARIGTGAGALRARLERGGKGGAPFHLEWDGARGCPSLLSFPWPPLWWATGRRAGVTWSLCLFSADEELAGDKCTSQTKRQVQFEGDALF